MPRDRTARGVARSATAVALLVLLVGLAACTPGASPPLSLPGASAAPADDPVRVAVCRPATLLPGDNLEVCGSEILAQLFTPLVRYDVATGEPVLAAASSLESDDQRIWRIEVREKLAFHDGEPVTARSFADAWDLVVAQGLETARYLERIEGWDEVAEGAADHLPGVEVLDEMTLEVTLTAPFSQFPLLLGFNPFFPLPRAVLDAPANASRNVVGNGPFRVTEVDDAGMLLERVEDHPGPMPAAPAVRYVFVDDDTDAFERLQDGEVDVAAVPPTAELGELEARLVTGEGVGLRYLSMPLDVPPFDDVRVRQALSLALDRRALAADVLGGVARPATGLIPPAAPGTTDVACEVCAFDPQRARELAAEAGLQGTLVVSGGGRLPGAIAEQWEATLEIEVELAGDTVQDLRDGAADGPVLAGWYLDYLSPQNAVAPLVATGGAANHNGFSLSDVDATIVAAGAAPDLEASIGGYRRAEALALSQLPVVPLVFDRRLVVHGDRVDVLVLDRLGQVSLRDLVPA